MRQRKEVVGKLRFIDCLLIKPLEQSSRFDFEGKLRCKTLGIRAEVMSNWKSTQSQGQLDGVVVK